MTDPVADMLTRIRNALAARRAEIVLPYSKFKHKLAELLVRQGMLEELSFPKASLDHKVLGLRLKYLDGKPVIGGLRRVSTPGRRVYTKSSEIPRAQSGLGITIVSTSKGLLTDGQARKQNLGGEVICQIW